jgi:hypothetical protein
VVRAAAVFSTVAAVLGAAGLLTSLSSLDAGTYVSEAGVPGTRYEGLYRASTLAIGASVGTLAFALRGVLRVAAAALVLATPFAFASGAVTCSPGCPLPPYERPTVADLVHGGSTVVALALCGLAILLLAWRGPESPLRTLARVGLAVAVPLLAASGVSLLFAGRGDLTGVLERLALVATLLWLIATALTAALGTSRPPSPGSR